MKNNSQPILFYLFDVCISEHHPNAHGNNNVNSFISILKSLYDATERKRSTSNKALKIATKNAVSISLVKTAHEAVNQNLNELDQSFMYTQILKEILLSIGFEQELIEEFLTYCREKFVGDTAELKNIDKLGKEYSRH